MKNDRLTADQQAATALSYLEYTKGIECGEEDEDGGLDVTTRRELTTSELRVKEAALDNLHYYLRYTPQEFLYPVNEQEEGGGFKCSLLGLFVVLLLAFAAFHVSHAVISLLIE